MRKVCICLFGLALLCTVRTVLIVLAGLLNLGSCLYEVGQYEECVVHLVSALSILREAQPTSQYTANGRGICFSWFGACIYQCMVTAYDDCSSTLAWTCLHGTEQVTG